MVRTDSKVNARFFIGKPLKSEGGRPGRCHLVRAALVAALGAQQRRPYSLSQIRWDSLCGPDAECQVFPLDDQEDCTGEDGNHAQRYLGRPVQGASAEWPLSVQVDRFLAWSLILDLQIVQVDGHGGHGSLPFRAENPELFC